MKKTHTTNELFEMLRTACQEQFGFNPTQVSAGMRYMGPLSSKEHRFRDTGTHSQIILQVDTGKARLLKKYEGQDYWDEAELAEYRKSDAQVKAERDLEEARTKAAAASAFFLTHAPYLRSLYRDHPEYKEENPSPWDGAELLLQKALRDGDPDAQAFADAMGTRKVNELAGRLLDPIGDEHQAEEMRRIRENPGYANALQALVALRAMPDEPKDAVDAAEEQFHELATEIRRSTSRSVPMSYVYFALSEDAKARKEATTE